jgi:hypothetical protein
MTHPRSACKIGVSAWERRITFQTFGGRARRVVAKAFYTRVSPGTRSAIASKSVRPVGVDTRANFSDTLEVEARCMRHPDIGPGRAAPGMGKEGTQ